MHREWDVYIPLEDFYCYPEVCPVDACDGTIFGIIVCSDINPRGAGGKYYPPSNFCDNFKTVTYIGMKRTVPYPPLL